MSLGFNSHKKNRWFSHPFLQETINIINQNKKPRKCEVSFEVPSGIEPL